MAAGLARRSDVSLANARSPSSIVVGTYASLRRHWRRLEIEVGLRGVASLRALLEAVEELQVRRARELGWSWQQIAELLGVSKQAVHQKYGTREARRRRSRR